MTRRVTSNFSSHFANHTLIMKFLTVVCVLATTWISAEGMQCTDDDLRPQEGKPIGINLKFSFNVIYLFLCKSS